MYKNTRKFNLSVLLSIILFAFIVTGSNIFPQQVQQIKKLNSNRLIKNYSVLKLFKVIKVKVMVSETNFSGQCPHRLNFTGEITTNSSGTVNYRWVRSDGAISPVKSLIFRKKGRKVVNTYWILGSIGRRYDNFWQAIQIISPNTLASNRAVFDLNCQLVTRLVFNRITGNITGGPQGNLIRARTVRVKLRKGGSLISSRVLTLNSNGRANYIFSGPYLIPGTYTITVEKVATSPGNPNNLNVCFNGTNPVSRTVVFSSTKKTVSNQDFIINFSIAWDHAGFCW